MFKVSADLGDGGVPLPPASHLLNLSSNQLLFNCKVPVNSFTMPAFNIVVFAGDHCGPEVSPLLC